MPDTFPVHPGWRLILTDLGVHPDGVLRQAGLPLEVMSRPGATLQPAEFYRFWETLDRATGDASLPTMIGQAISIEAFDPPIFAGVCSSDLAAAARRIATYKRLCGPIRLVVTESRDDLELRMMLPPEHDVPPVFYGFEIAFWVAFVRLTTRHRVVPLRTTCPGLSHDGAFADWVGAPVEDAPHVSLRFSAEDARRPFLTRNDALWAFFEPSLRQRLAELDTSAQARERVRAALLELLPAGTSSMSAVARTLGMSTRTLQRRLKAEGTTFLDVLHHTREALARHYLRTSPMPAAEISFLLGFEDPNSFYRAFHGWTGTTPERLRAAAG